MGTVTRRRAGDDAGSWGDQDAFFDASGGPGGRGRGGKGGRGRGGKPSLFGRHPVISIVAIVTTVCLTGVLLTIYVAYRNVYDSIHHEAVSGDMLGDRPPVLSPGSLNLLLIGSDSRKGTHGRFGKGIDGSRSDTAMLMHISPSHSQVDVLSFPRDTMVPAFKCLADGQGHPGQSLQRGVVEPLNWTFSYGGAPCLWKTLEQTTHIHIDHFVEVNFASFRQIVNDVGGVPVCLPYPIHDKASGLNLKAGRHVVQGGQALAFVRERHVGEGSDLQRIDRQQLFLVSLMQKVKASGTLASPAHLFSLVRDVAGALTTDISSPTTLLAIANSLKGLDTKAVQFLTAPVDPYPPNPQAQVQFKPDASTLFSAIAHDNHIAKAERNATKPGASSPSPDPTVSPGQVSVQVLNGTATPNLASTTGSGLTSKGFSVTFTGNAPSASPDSVIEYGSDAQLPEVNTLKAEIAGAKVQKTTGVPHGQLTLILGASFKGLSTTSPSPSPSSGPDLGKDFGGMSGNANICSKSAFSGPDRPNQFTP